MDSGGLDSRRIRFDSAHETTTHRPKAGTALRRPHDESRDHLQAAINRTCDFLLDQQASEGYWVGELEGDTILESEYILLLTFLGQGDSDEVARCARYIARQQRTQGGWAIYPGGPLEISASVKAYFALKIAGYDPNSEEMVRAREAILVAGGAERINSFTRFYLALLGVISYRQCPCVPPELMLIPKWAPFSIYEMSSWSRTILVPLSILWAYCPQVQLPPEQGIRELFLSSPEELPVSMPPSEVVDRLHKKTWVNWRSVFNGVDRFLKFLEVCKLHPLRSIAVKRAENWMMERFANSDGLGAIFPPIIWSVIALKCLGHKDDSPSVVTALNELRKLVISEGEDDRLQPCKSPVWDTAIATIALRDAGIPPRHPAIQASVRWLLSRQVSSFGDWSVRNPAEESGGWYFEFNNDFYPDVDDTGMVCIALTKCLPGHRWTADFLLDGWSPHELDRDVSAVIAGRAETREDAYASVEAMRPVLTAVRKGARWVQHMQNRDGGWGAFDRDNNREIYTQVPFADHNAMIDPSTADLTARMLEMYGGLNVPAEHSDIQRAIEYVSKAQEDDGSWYGRWGVNFIYGTWQAIVGLRAIGISVADIRIRRGAKWLKSAQLESGGWGESAATYDDPSLKGQGPATASQTAWALLGLIAAGQHESDAVRKGVEYLINTQKADGTWDEPWYTGTGFPKVFYLKYHLYRIYFPLMALSRYNRACGGNA